MGWNDSFQWFQVQGEGKLQRQENHRSEKPRINTGLGAVYREISSSRRVKHELLLGKLRQQRAQMLFIDSGAPSTGPSPSAPSAADPSPGTEQNQQS